MTESVSDPALSAIVRRSRRVAAVLGAAVLVLPVAVVLYVFLFPEMLAAHPGVAVLKQEPRPLDLIHRFAASGALLLEGLPAGWGLWHLRRLFQGYAAGAVFTQAAARHFRCFAWAVILMAVTRPLGWLLLSLVIASGGKDGPHGALSFSSEDLVMILIGSALLIIGRVMGEAARIADDNAGFV